MHTFPVLCVSIKAHSALTVHLNLARYPLFSLSLSLSLSLSCLPSPAPCCCCVDNSGGGRKRSLPEKWPRHSQQQFLGKSNLSLHLHVYVGMLVSSLSLSLSLFLTNNKQRVRAQQQQLHQHTSSKLNDTCTIRNAFTLVTTSGIAGSRKMFSLQHLKPAQAHSLQSVLAH